MNFITIVWFTQITLLQIIIVNCVESVLVWFWAHTVAPNEICGQSDGTNVFPMDFTLDIHGYVDKMCPGNIWPGFGVL